MIRTGISVFAGMEEYSLEDNLKYLELASSLGIQYVFSSAHINEAKFGQNDLQSLIDKTLSLKMKLSLDISKPMMDKFVIPDGLYALRLDYGFTDEDIVKMSNECPFIIELNASTISLSKMDKLIEMGLKTSNVCMSFNYYPKLYTGHDILDVYKQTTIFKRKGFIVSAFIPSFYGKRPPMYEGLPTVENHRKMSLDLAIEELKACNIDGIYFGDAYADIEELKTLVNHQDDELMLKIITNNPSYINEDYLYNIRIDMNSLMLRIGNSRCQQYIEPSNQIERKKYDVTIDNHLFKRYQGELNIILTDLPQDSRTNVIGRLETTDFIIEGLKRSRKFKFIIKK